MKKKKRIEWIDYAKAIGIMLVVFGHCYECSVTNWLYSFHMPLFFFLSGLTFRVQGDFFSFAKKKAKALMLPYVAYAAVHFAWVTFIKVGGRAAIPKHLLGIVVCLRNSDYSSGMWFLPLLFFSELLLYGLINGIRKKGLRAAVVAVLGGMSFAYCAFVGKPLPYGLDVVPLAALFVYSGFAVRGRVGKPNPIVLLACLALNMLAGWANGRIAGGRIDLYYSRLGNPALYFLAAFFGIAATVLLCRMLKGGNRLLSVIGRNTLHIYCIHQILIEGIHLVVKKFELFDPTGNQAAVILVNLGTLVFCIAVSLVWVRLLGWVKGKWKGQTHEGRKTTD